MFKIGHSPCYKEFYLEIDSQLTVSEIYGKSPYENLEKAEWKVFKLCARKIFFLMFWSNKLFHLEESFLKYKSVVDIVL